MEGGLARSILAAHLGRRHPELALGFEPDPNALVEAWSLQDALQKLRQRGGDAALRLAAADYVALWARTFRTLVRHLRGRPERALSLFAGEVYPYLRGDRLAARVHQARVGEAVLVLQPDLPEAYLAGLVEAFVGLSGAQARCEAQGHGHFRVTYLLQGRDRFARLVQTVVAQRLHLVACALGSALVGLAVAARLAGPLEAWRLAAVLGGAVAVQFGANALHDLRHPHPAGPLSLRPLDRRAWLMQARLGYGVAAAAGLALAVEAPLVVLFAALGLVLSFLFGHLRNRGWGPLVAVATYGPILAAGAMAAVWPGATWDGASLAGLLLAVPSGLLAGAILYVDDLADRPLDEAGGNRTLLVRLPRRRHLAGYAGLLLAAIGVLGGGLWGLGADVPFLVAALALAAALLVGLVRRNLDHPRNLAPARFGTMVLHLAATAIAVLALLEVIP